MQPTCLFYVTKAISNKSENDPDKDSLFFENLYKSECLYDNILGITIDLWDPYFTLVLPENTKAFSFTATAFISLNLEKTIFTTSIIKTKFSVGCPYPSYTQFILPYPCDRIVKLYINKYSLVPVMAFDFFIFNIKFII